jgi:peptide/nickel transport system substrate-binding protein
MNHKTFTTGKRLAGLLSALAILALLAGSLQILPAQAGHSTEPNPALQGFIIGIGYDPEGLDPALVTSGDAQLVTAQIYDTLVTLADGGSLPQPGLATAWSVAANQLTWTFRVRPGVKFQDGTDFNAAAVVFNFLRWWDPANPYHNGSFDYFAYLMGGFKGDSNSLVTGVSAIDATHVAITTTFPINYLPTLLAMPALAIASPAAIQAGTLITTPVGTGAYQFHAWTPGSDIRLDAYLGYWGAAPSLQTLTFDVISDNDDRYTSLKLNSIQAANDLSEGYANQAAADSNLKTIWRPANDVGYLGMTRSHPPLDNILVRQAIAHAINRQHLIATYYGPGDQQARQYLPPMIWGNNPATQDTTYDPTLAKSLLAQAGFTKGITTTLGYRNVYRSYLPNPAAVANAIKADLQTVGITVTVNLYQPGDFINKVGNGDLDLYLIGWAGDYPHPNDYFKPVLCDGYKAFGPRDDLLCNTLQDTLAVPDFNTQLANYQWASQRVQDTLPLLPLAYGRLPLIVRWNVAGLAPSILSTESYRKAFIATSFNYLPLLSR